MTRLLARLTPGRRLVLGLGCVLALLTTTLVTDVAASRRQTDLTNQIVRHLDPARLAAQNVVTLVRSIDDDGAWMVDSYAGNKRRYVQLAATYYQEVTTLKTTMRQALTLADTTQQRQAIRRLMAFYWGTQPLSAADRTMLDAQTHDVFTGDNGYLFENEKVLAEVRAGHSAKAALDYTMVPFVPALQSAQSYIAVVQDEIDQATTQEMDAAHVALVLSVGVGLLSLVLCVAVGRGVAERLRVERALRTAEGRFRASFEQAAVGMARTTLDGVMLDANDRMCRILGYTRAELLGMRSREFTHPEDLARSLQFLGQVNKGMAGNFEQRYIRKDGTVVWGDASSAVVYGVDGEALYRISALQDVTARKMAEESVRESEEQYRRIVETAQEGILQVDTSAHITYMNKRGADLLGYNPEEMVGRPLRDFVDEDGRATLDAVAARRTADGVESVTYPLKFKHRSGTDVWVLISGSPLYEDAGRLVGRLRMFTDITARRQAEEEAHAAAAQLRRNFDHAALGMAVIGMDGRYLQVNPALCRMLGYSAEELLTVRMQEITHPDEKEGTVQALASVVNGALPSYHVEKRYVHRDGHTVWAEVHSTAVHDAEGRPLHLVNQTQDISRRKQAEEALRAAEERYRTLVEHLPMITYMSQTAGKGGYFYISPQFESLLGFTVAEWTADNKFWSTRLHPDDRARVLELDAHFHATGEPLRAEYRYLARDGRVVWFQEEAVLVRDDLGQPRYKQGMMLDITSRKQAEERLRQSEERYRTIIAASPDAVVLTDLDGLILLANQQAATLHGYVDADAAVAPDQWVHIAPEDHACFREVVARVVATGEVGRLEYAALRRDGSRFAAEGLAARMVDAEGRPTGITTVVRDITERKRTEEELRTYREHLEETVAARTAELLAKNDQLAAEIAERTRAEAALRDSESKFRTIFEDSNDAILLVTEEGYFDCNPRALQIYGDADKEHFLGLAPGRISSPVQPDGRDSRAAMAGHIQSALREGYRRFEWMFRRVNGEDFQGDVLFSRIEWGGKNVLQATVRDISARKAMENALRASQSQLALAMDLVQLAHWEYDRASDTFLVDDQYYALYGTTTEREGRSTMSPALYVREFVHPDDAYLIAEHFAGAAAADGPHASIQFEHRIIRRDGEIRTIAVRFHIMRDAAGQFVSCHGANQDVTDRKRAEEELQRAKEAAEVAARAKSAFLASMSHEIRTPMNAILGFAQLLLRDPVLTPAQQEYLGVISRSGEHLLTLINDILEVAKIEAGRTTLNTATFDLHALLTDLAALFRMRAEAKGLQLLVERTAAVPRYIVSDEGKVRQMLINLLGNAVKFTTDGGISLRVDARLDAERRLRLLAEVEDSGPGIADEELGLLFQRFAQTSSGARVQGGTGLGLAISREYARMLDGDITVSSQVGRGSIFRVEMSLTVGKPEAVATNGPLRRVVGLLPGQPAWRILIVDDREDNRTLLTHLLQGVGIATREAVDGADALQAFATWRPHMILMDMRMPVMDGYEAMRRIRADAHGRDVTIIAVTASAFAEDNQSILAAGADDYLAKPFRAAMLFEQLGRHLDIAFIYDDNTGPVGDPKSGGRHADLSAHASEITLLPVDLAGVPVDLIAQLREATLNGDLARILEVTDQVGAFDAQSARALRALAERFDYQTLLAHLGSHGEAA